MRNNRDVFSHLLSFERKMLKISSLVFLIFFNLLIIFIFPGKLDYLLGILVFVNASICIFEPMNKKFYSPVNIISGLSNNYLKSHIDNKIILLISLFVMSIIRGSVGYLFIFLSLIILKVEAQLIIVTLIMYTLVLIFFRMLFIFNDSQRVINNIVFKNDSPILFQKKISSLLYDFSLLLIFLFCLSFIFLFRGILTIDFKIVILLTVLILLQSYYFVKSWSDESFFVIDYFNSWKKILLSFVLGALFFFLDFYLLPKEMTPKRTFMNVLQGNLGKESLKSFSKKQIDELWYQDLNPLHLAIKNENLEITEFLLSEIKMNINQLSLKSNISPLLFAVKTGDRNMVKLIIDHGGKINLRNSKGQNAIAIAAQSCRPDIVKLLLLKNGDLENIDINGETPLFYAVRGNCIDSLEFLISYGSNLKKKNKKGEDYLDVAKKYYPHFFTRLNFYEKEIKSY